MPAVISYYDRDGYRVDVVGGKGGNGLAETVYTSSDSGALTGTPLRTIRRYAANTGREIAAEYGITFAGVEREGEDA